MRTIWKFPFLISGVIDIDMPCDAEVVAVDVQNGAPAIWALVSPDAKVETRHFRCYGTGHPIADGDRHVGTFQLVGGTFVGHLFEVGGA